MNWNEQRDLFYFLPKHLRAAALLKVNTGLRESELCTLTWDMEVEIPELDTTAFILTRTKNGEERLVVLNSIARDVLEAQRNIHESAVFTYAKKPLKGVENTAWRRAWRDADLPCDPLTMRGVHNPRHTFGHRLRAAGISIEDRKALLGHKSREITTHYSVPDIARLIECVEKVTTERETVILNRPDFSGGSIL